jgi:hypothetical protein
LLFCLSFIMKKSCKKVYNELGKALQTS